MNINGQNINIDDLFNDKYFHKKINNNLYLSEYQIEVLKRNKIEYERCTSARELLFEIAEVLDECDDEELEIIEREISEYDYYANTNK